MSAVPGHPSLRARIASALGDVLASNSSKALADQLGVAGTTITRRADDLSMWPATDFLKLAVTNESLACAVHNYLQGDLPAKGEAVAVVSDLHRLLGDSGRLITEAGAVLQDGRVDVDEARHLRTTVTAALANLELLIRDLDAVVVAG